MTRSSAGFMKSRSTVKPGTGVPLTVKACFDSAPNPDGEAKKIGSAHERLQLGLKKSLMALRFLLGCSIVHALDEQFSQFAA